jgi:hypothetical protein
MREIIVQTRKYQPFWPKASSFRRAASSHEDVRCRNPMFSSAVLSCCSPEDALTSPTHHHRYCREVHMHHGAATS